MTDQNKKIEIVQDSNESILNNINYYLEFLREKIKEIIAADGLQYSEPMEKKKIYPAFTYTQFLYLLSRLYDTVYSVNKELLYNNNKLRSYDEKKVKLAYEVYFRLCQFYGFTCAVEPFTNMTGVSYDILLIWLSSGKSNLLKNMRDNAQNTVISRFENSPVPLLQLAAANHKYNLSQAIQEREEETVLEVLPDLLALTDSKKELTGDEHGETDSQ